MKTLILSLAFLLCFSEIPVNAQNTFVADPSSLSAGTTATQAEIFTRIQQTMRVPESMKSMISSERVRVVFTIDETGKAHVLDVGTRRPELTASVISQFEAIDFTDAKDTGGQMFSIWLNFKVM